MTRTDRRNLRNGLLFASPYVIGFTAFTLYPFAASIYYSFCDYNVVTPPVWTGLANYRAMFFEDAIFWKSLGNTLVYTALSVPFGLVLSIAIAMLLNQKLRGMAAYRTIFFLPTIVPIVAVSVLWLWVLNPESGLLNGVLLQVFGPVIRAFDLPLPGWLSSETWSKPALALMSFWSVGGAVVIFLAGLSDIPESLYESADIDGAGRLAKFTNVTIPMLTPTILFNLVMGLINAFQYFTQVYVMTAGMGGPADSTMVYALYLYKNAFNYLRMGYACAMAWMLFVVVLAATVLLMVSSKRWVYYHAD